MELLDPNDPEENMELMYPEWDTEEAVDKVHLIE
jgi:hypothetical protein